VITNCVVPPNEESVGDEIEEFERVSGNRGRDHPDRLPDVSRWSGIRQIGDAIVIEFAPGLLREFS
jgi:hypothetical protein